MNLYLFLYLFIKNESFPWYFDFLSVVMGPNKVNPYPEIGEDQKAHPDPEGTPREAARGEYVHLGAASSESNPPLRPSSDATVEAHPLQP